jgi:hypothetical protein
MFTYREQHEKHPRNWVEKNIDKAIRSLNKEQIARLNQEEGKLDQVFGRMLDLIQSEIEKDFRKNKAATLKEHRIIAGAFKKSHNHTWKTPIDLLETFIFMNLEYHEKLYGTYHRKKSKDTRFKVLMGLHGKSILHSFEILELLKGGFADGALSRWRSLYETAIIMIFLSKNDAGLSQQFLDHSVVQEYKDALEFQRNCIYLGYKPYSTREMESFTARKDKIVSKYTSAFKKDYGWLCNFLPEPYTFRAIEKETYLSHFRSFYKMASHGVHSGPKSILFSLASLNSKKWMPAGPSNFGMADPGKNTAYTLFWSTSAIASFDSFLETSVFLKLSAKLCGEIGDQFFNIQDKIESEEKELNRKIRRKHLRSG